MSAIANVSNLQNGNLLQALYSRGVRNLLSQEAWEFDAVKRYKVSNSQAKQINFNLLSGTAPGSIRYAPLGTASRAFGAGYRPTTGEYTAYLKQIEASLVIDWDLLDRALTTPEKYGDYLAITMAASSRDQRRRIAADFYGDGTGVVGTVSSVSDTNIDESNGGTIVVTLKTGDADRGCVGQCEIGDLLLGKQTDGTARAPSGGSGFSAYKVTSKSRKNATVTLKLVQSDGDTVASNYTASNLVAGDFLYRAGQTTYADLSGTVSTDYGMLTEVFAGLESLGANDGRTVHGITMSGVFAGTQEDQAGDLLEAQMIQSILDTVKVNVGKGAYRYANMTMSPENLAKLINANELDRRFTQADDPKRGCKVWSYQHEQDQVKAVTTEFIHPKRIWGLPEQSSGDKVIEYYGTDFKPVKVPGQSTPWMLAPDTSTAAYQNVMVQYLVGRMTLVAKHAAAIWSIRNFS